MTVQDVPRMLGVAGHVFRRAPTDGLRSPFVDIAQSSERDLPPLAVDLFAGAGGMTQGFRDAGFKVVQAVERDAGACATYASNHPDVDVICADIQTLDPVACMHRLNLAPGEIGTVIGGPPCQGFSESNRRTRTLDNPLNHLYLHFLRFVETMRPVWVVCENVAGLRTMAGGAILDRMLAGLEKAGYRAKWRLLNSVSHGVPQVRRRLFVIANRLRKPIPTERELTIAPLSTAVTVREAIGDLPVLPNGASTDILEYRTDAESDYQRRMRKGAGTLVSGNLVTRNAVHVKERYLHIPEGGNWKDIPARLLGNYADTTRCHTGIYHRLYWDRPAKVIGNFRKNMLVHPAQGRGLSIREAARLQGFQDTYRFLGTIGPRQQQVADAVPPLLAEAVAKAIFRSSRSHDRTHRADTLLPRPTGLTDGFATESASLPHLTRAT